MKDYNACADRLKEFIYEKNYPMFSLSVVGEDMGNIDIQLQNVNRCNDSYSVAKAYTVTAFGLAYDKGLIKPEDKVADILSKYLPDSYDKRWHNITCDHAMKHRMGLPGGFLDIDAFDPREFGRDYLDYMFRAQFTHEPGVDDVYTDGAFYLMARAVEEVCGEPIDNLLWRELFFDMEYTEFAWSRCPMGHPMGGTGLYVTSRDMAKLGELYRMGGKWNGRQLLSKEWCDIVISRGYELNPVGIRNAYGKGGMAGQMLTVFPDKKFSAAWHAFGFDSTYELLNEIDRLF